MIITVFLSSFHETDLLDVTLQTKGSVSSSCTFHEERSKPSLGITRLPKPIIVGPEVVPESEDEN
eukprot:1181952-Prorocentrum_minimum.AAC.2